MKYYLHNFLALISLQLKVLLEDRMNAANKFLLSIINIGTTIAFVEIVFTFTTDIAGWNKYQVMTLSGLYQVFGALFSMFFLRSLNMIPQYIHSGELDIFLTKPINPQFYVSFRSISILESFRIISGVAVILFATRGLFIEPKAYLMLIIGLIIGIAIFYSIYFMIATLVFWTGKLESLYEIYGILAQPLSVPLNVLGREMSFLFMYVIPLGFVITVPARLFLGMSGAPWLLLSAVLGSVFLAFSSWFWNFALRHYTSASS